MHDIKSVLSTQACGNKLALSSDLIVLMRFTDSYHSNRPPPLLLLTSVQHTQYHTTHFGVNGHFLHLFRRRLK